MRGLVPGGCEGATVPPSNYRTRWAPTLAPRYLRTFVPLALLQIVITPAAPYAQGLTGAPQLASVYDAIFDARFDDAARLTAAACRPSDVAQGRPPAEACLLLQVVSTWWEIQLDPLSRAADARLLSQADAAIAAIERWTEREPQRAEAWFYLGAALGAKAQWQALRGEKLAAARRGARIKAALERALVLDPSLQDAQAGIGLYRYYAAVAPLATRMLRWILLLPGGDREDGLDRLRRAASSGLLVRDEADYQLHTIELWYEKQPARAVALLRGLDARHPRNPHFLQLIAEIEDYQMRDFDASRRTYEQLLERALEGRVSLPAFAEVHARLGVARLALPEDALPHLGRVIAMRPTTPMGAIAQAQLQRGEMLDRLGRREDASAAYRAAIAASLDGDPMETARKAKQALSSSRVR